MAEWSNAAVLKTVDLHGSGGSNPSLSAKVQKKAAELVRAAFFMRFGSAPPQAGRDVGAERRNPGERDGPLQERDSKNKAVFPIFILIFAGYSRFLFLCRKSINFRVVLKRQKYWS